MLEGLGLRSFTQEYKSLRRMMTDDESDFSSSKATQALLRAQLAAVIRAIGVADRNMLAGDTRGTYAYVALHGLTRELVNDLRSFGDQSENIDRIRRDVVQEVLRILATNVVADLIKTRQNICSRLPDRPGVWVEKQLKSFQENLAVRMQEADVAADTLIRRALGG